MLIVVGIIGIIAGCTIPSLLHDTSKQETLSKLKKEYTSLAQAVKMSEVQNGSNEYWNWGTVGDLTSVKAFFDNNLAPYLNITKYCNTYQDCGYNENSAIKTLKGDSRFSVIEDVQGRTVLLADGSLLKTQVNKVIFVDINAGKGPNVLGKDVFRFTLDSTKGFVPYGYHWPSGTINSGCSALNWGYECAAKIIFVDNWQIKDDYPWK